MPDITATLPDTHFRVSQRVVKTVIETHRQESFTGLMRLRYPSGADLILTFLDGVQHEMYSCLHPQMEVIPWQSWSYSMDRPDASIAYLSLPVEAMRLVRVAHEAPILRFEQAKCPGTELTRLLESWSAENSPILLHLQTDTTGRLYSIVAHSTPIIEELALVDNEARFSITDAGFPNSLPDAEYHATWYVSDCEGEVWQEYRLRYAFSPFIRMVLNRFSQLAGRVLTERLCEQLSMWLKEGGCQIRVTSNGITNRHYFKSFYEAKKVYLELIRRFNQEAGRAIGLRMAEDIWRETLLKMDPHPLELIKRHLYDKDGLDHAGTVWRYES